MKMKRFGKRIFSILCAAALLTLNSCGSAEPLRDTFFSMDTVITVSLDAGTPDAEAVLAHVREETERLRLIFDAHDPASELSRRNAGEAMDPSEEFRALESEAFLWAAKTGGAFDPTLLPLRELWEAAEKRGSVPTGTELSGTLALCGWEKAATDARPRLRLDFGGIAKGRVTEELVRLLSETSGAGWGVVSVGGNVGVFGEKPDGKPFSVALRDPQNTSGTLGTISAQNGDVIAVSGNYERFYEIGGERYGHISDPQTGLPADSGLCSVAVICRDGALADLLSTALFVMGTERGLELYRAEGAVFEAIFISPDTVTVTPGLGSRFELTGNYTLRVAD